MRTILTFALFASFAFGADAPAVSTTAEEREAILRMDIARKEAEAARDTTTIQFLQFLEQKRVDLDKMAALRLQALAPLQQKCASAGLVLDEKTYNCTPKK